MSSIIKLLAKKTSLVCILIFLIINPSARVFASVNNFARDNSNLWLIAFVIIIIGIILTPKKLRSTIIGILLGIGAVYLAIRQIGIIENINWFGDNG